MPSSLLRRKDVDACQEDAERSEHRLKRSLGVFDLTALGIGAIIGAGIFATIGTAAAGGARPRRRRAGARSCRSCSRRSACGFAALCYAEFASMVPIPGSAYTYAYATLGELVAWIIGWDLILEYAVGNVAVAVSWADYFQSLLAGLRHPHAGLAVDRRSTSAQHIPGLLDTAPHVFGVPIVFNLPAAAIVALHHRRAGRSASRSRRRFNTVMVVLKLVAGRRLRRRRLRSTSQPANWHPFAPNGCARHHGRRRRSSSSPTSASTRSRPTAEEAQEPAARHADRA